MTVDPNPQILNPSPLAPVRRRIVIFSVVATALLMNALDSTIVATALHSIQHGLHSSINWTSWVITGYSVGLVLALSLAGKLSDRFGRRRFAPVNVINLLTGAVFGMTALVPLYAVDRYRISALGSGTLLTAESFAVIAIAIVAAMALRRTGYRIPIYLGFGCVVAGMIMLAIRPPALSAYLWLAISACVVGVGEGLSSPASRNAGLQLAPDRSAALAALRSTWIQVGEITSVSITAAILARAYSPGQLQAKVYIAFALLLVLCTPVITRVPEHRGSW